jgi:hypothetical protein
MNSMPKAPQHRGDIESVPTSAGLGYSQSSALVQTFDKFASWVTRWTGSPIAFALAIASIVVWVVTGPIFHYSDTWQLVINTGTTIVTFLMVFLIQESQNKDSIAGAHEAQRVAGLTERCEQPDGGHRRRHRGRAT